VAALHQKRWTQHLNGVSIDGGVVMSNDSESLNNMLDNCWYVLSGEHMVQKY
jgi:hypothetical protein